MLLSTEVDPILEKWSCKRDILMACGTGHGKIILALLTEVIIFYIWALIIQIGVPSLKKAILEYGICLKLAIFLDLNKQF